MSTKEKDRKGELKDLIPYTLRFDDIQHRKLKVIAALHGDSLSAYLVKIFDEKIAEWEREHGGIEIPKK